VVTTYYYEYLDLNWKEINNPEPFNQALENTAPDVRIFGLLKAEANMGIKLGWRGIMEALNHATDMQLLDQDQVQKYRKHMIDKSSRQMKTEGMHPDLHYMNADIEQAAEDLLKRKFVIRPRHVMATLAG